ncbi:protein farnesyltransferase/geranylgeranyltransferase type-1 subunit alpha [Venturia canescens]|uniref:protein farnesyltransferase/geranylgeranyltransferase type-1 subunit alpha n=1 Tax=Venturia canescens TaxID=32260 RepID=UPI001C9C40E8|nr:protein farnesyltransferase/geranylgeranyltransferase type-1 subunit alpha [Venturia canescens]
MPDSSDEEPCDFLDNKTERPWIPYRDREEWKDVVPVPQDDGPHPVAAIAYSDKFKDCYDYFRAILKSGEKSERTLALTVDCIWSNPANYTVWQYRREILEALGKDLREELKYIDAMITENAKNYQVWHHRKVIVEWLQDASDELSFTEAILKKDPKNYHTWQHRQWCIKTFDLFDKELEYVEQLLLKDIRNNSAWNQRYFVLKYTTNFEQEVVDREVDFALAKISIVKGNESAWNYLRGILAHDTRGGLAKNEKVMKLCEELYLGGCRVNHLLACIIDICRERHDSVENKSFYTIEHALSLCKDLADEHDKIRRRYWDFVTEQLRDKLPVDT